MALAAPVAADDHVISPGTGAIQAAVNAASDGDTIVLNPGLYYDLASITISSKSLTFRADTANGHGPLDTIIGGPWSGDSIFFVPDGSSLVIDNLTLQNGHMTGGGNGGAINSPSGSVTVRSSTFKGFSLIGAEHHEESYGGAIYASSVTAISTTFSGCTVNSFDGYASGGAIFADTVTITSSTFSGCSATTTLGTAQGGAIYARNSVTVTSSTFSECSAMGSQQGQGGAIFALNYYSGSVMVTSSTFSGCSASGVYSHGGAIFTSSGSGSVTFCRLVDNHAGTVIFGPVSATDTWWGNSTPSGKTGEGATASPWLVLGATASPGSISTTQTATVRANLTFHSDGTTVSPAPGTIPDWTPVTFTATGGTVSPAYVGMENGVATTTFTPSGAGTASITATVDYQSVTIPVTVTTPAAGTNVTSIVIDPLAPANVYAGLDGSGIYRSSNAGSTWTNTGTQPTNMHIRALAINPAITSRLWAGTYGGGVFRSINSGTDWSACTAPANPYVLSLVRNASGSLYAGTDDGIFVSSDDCASWMALNGGLP